jgi:hypothetical protein
MTPNPRYRHSWESGLSEVVGFVLILGVLVLVFSLYLTYGIPAQGRENEILHMNEVKDQFVAYKISMDSLFNNNKVGTMLGNSFSLGTGGGYTQGMVSFLPIMSPVSSGGVIAINQRTPVHETLNITSHSLVRNDTYRMSVDFQEGVPLVPRYTPDHLFVNISGILLGDLNPAGYYGADIGSRNWNMTVNMTPRASHYNETQAVTCPVLGGPCTIIYNTGESYIGTDITINVRKEGVTTIRELTVYRNVTPGSHYAIDLMDETYGVSSSIRPRDTISLIVEKPLNTVQATGNATYDFTDMDPYRITPIPLGSLEYRAQNNYWIPQSYYYQMGGVFLSQAEGNVSYKLPPEISFSNDSAHDLVSVNINALTIDANDRGLIGGNSPVQVRTMLDSIVPLPYVAGDEITGNSKQVWIGVNTSDPRANAMWESYFESAARGSGIPAGEFNVSRLKNESYIAIYGVSADPDVNDIRLTVTNATYSTWVHGVGGVYE